MAGLIRLFGRACLHGHIGTGFGYRIAGHELLSDVPLPLLAEYASGSVQPSLRDERVPSVESDAATVKTTGWLAGMTRRVVSRSGQAAYGLEIADFARFVVAKSGGGIFCAGAAAGVAPKVLEEALLGPPLAFALALQGVWCLHASAALRQGREVLLLAASGRGKSTLAAFLDGA